MVKTDALFIPKYFQSKDGSVSGCRTWRQGGLSEHINTGKRLRILTEQGAELSSSPVMHEMILHNEKLSSTKCQKEEK